MAKDCLADQDQQSKCAAHPSKQIAAYCAPPSVAVDLVVWEAAEDEAQKRPAAVVEALMGLDAVDEAQERPSADEEALVRLAAVDETQA